ncbi:MAG: AMP-binding protein [Rhizobiaceae bacterium]|nr:AMP-binding protein [Rhizobiaceae bacterium]
MTSRINLGELLHNCAKKFNDRPFLTIAPSGQTWSYSAFEQYVNRLAHGFRTLWKAPPSHAAILLENSIEYLAASYALKKLGVVEVSINRTFRGPALARTIALTNAPVIITSPAHFDALLAIRAELKDIKTLVVTEDRKLAQELFPEWEIKSLNKLLADRDDHITNSADDLSTAAIMFTSGTTGVSKGCVLSHRYAVRTAENVIPPFRVTEDDVVYSPYPLSHIGPAYYDVLPTMMTGGRVVLRDGFSLSNFWQEIQKFEVTWFMMLGSVQQLLWAAPEQAEEREHKVSRCWATPAPVPKEDFDRRFNTHLIPGGGYGSTDAGWIVAPQWDHPGGIVLPEFEVSIVDDNGNPVPAGQSGEMLVRSKEPGIMSDEYFGMPEKTLESRRNFWFHTGDIAKLDNEGLFYFQCRKAERIRVKGEMVSGFEVEEGILSHVDVEDCAVVGVPSALGEEEIKAFIVLKPGKCLTIEDIQKHCNGRMARHMIPAQVAVLEEIPRTPTGKPEKGKLAKMMSH